MRKLIDVAEVWAFNEEETRRVKIKVEEVNYPEGTRYYLITGDGDRSVMYKSLEDAK